MKKTALLLLVLLLAAQAGYAKDWVLTKEAGDYTVEVRIDKNPPVYSENKVTVAISDKDGAPVKDAAVRIEYSMPPMPGMPPMDYKADAELKKDKYVATMTPGMSGSWNITVKFKRPEGKVEKMGFTVDVR